MNAQKIMHQPLIISPLKITANTHNRLTGQECPLPVLYSERVGLLVQLTAFPKQINDRYCLALTRQSH